MLSEADLRFARDYAPILLLDENEPFVPARVGATVLRSAGASPSFPRSFAFDEERLDAIIEYAVYWDYDITHLYDLEHVWIYVGKDGSVLDAEASFHGKYLKGLLEDRSNLEGNRVRLYVQPGKHALSPLAAVFKLLPDATRCAWEDAGKDGLLVTAAFRGAFESSPDIDRAVRTYLQRYRFAPTWRFAPYDLPKERFTSWEGLRREVPERIEACLEDIRETLRGKGGTP
ncbi:hypothetical protein MO973_22150 [Paenibacillus sp. TRM 82003]|nr:hypothetical protein [Paenibacillus sp. TRM 82003]